MQPLTYGNLKPLALSWFTLNTLIRTWKLLSMQSLIYGNLKPSNLLLDENGRIKLGGFGLSRHLHNINNASPSKHLPVRFLLLTPFSLALPPLRAQPEWAYLLQLRSVAVTASAHSASNTLVHLQRVAGSQQPPAPTRRTPPDDLMVLLLVTPAAGHDGLAALHGAGAVPLRRQGPVALGAILDIDRGCVEDHG